MLVSRGGDTNAAFAVDYFTTNSTAMAALDYGPVSGTLHFAAGVNTQPLSIPIIDDQLAEGDEMFLLSLSNPTSGVQLGSYASTSIVIIVDNEVPSVVDPTFRPGAGALHDVHAVLLQPDGKILIGGELTQFDQTNRGHIARLNPDGSLDLSFDTSVGADGDVYAMALQSDGRVLIGGAFANVNGIERTSVARLNIDGTLDSILSPVINGQLRAVAVQSDGKILIAGQFTTVAYDPRARVARLNSDGTLDRTFDPGTGANGNVRSLVLQPDGRILIGGRFTTFNGVARSRVARLLATGAVDPSFDPGSGADDQVRAIALQSDGQIYIGGDFEVYNGIKRSAVARLRPDGSLDVDFDQGDPDGDVVRGIAVQDDGQVWIAGFFKAAGGGPRQNLALLDASGHASADFPGASFDDEVFSVLLQPDRNIVIGGDFHSVNGAARRHVARLLQDSTTNTFEFTATNYNGYEVTGGASITVQRTGNSSNTVSVIVRTENDSARAGLDYEATTATATFAPFETLKTIIVPLFNRGEGQPERSARLSLSQPSTGSELGVWPESVLTIANNASRVWFAAPAVTVGEEAGKVVLTLIRHGKLSQEVSVDYTTVDGTATAGLDYIPQSGTLVFPAQAEWDWDDNDNLIHIVESSQSITVPILNDGIQEGDESFTVKLSNPRGGVLLSTPTNQIVSIRDNELGFSFDVPPYGLWAGEPMDAVIVTVNKNWDTTSSASVDYFTRDGTALAGSDYIARQGRLVFAPNEQSKTISIPLLNDGLPEPMEWFEVVLTNALGGPVLLKESATISFYDNDGGIEFDPAVYNVRESSGSVTIHVQRNDDDTNVVTVEFTTRDGSGRASVDYTAQSGTLTFPAGITSGSITVPIFPNRDSLTTRTFFVDLRNASANVTIGTHNAAQIKILDDVQPGDVDLDFAVSDSTARFSAMTVQSDGHVLIGYSLLYSAERQPIGRVKGDGSTDESFHPDIGFPNWSETSAILVRPDGRILWGGTYAPFNPDFPHALVSDLEPGGALRNYVDLGFGPWNPPGAISSFSLQSDQKVLIGGSLSGKNFLRLGLDGAPDPTFLADARANAAVSVIVADFDGKILVGGEFTQINGTARNHLARLNEDGSLDTSFLNSETNAGCDGPVRRLARLPDGKLLVAGDFNRIQGELRPFLARLNADGSLDQAFPADAPNARVLALGRTISGKIVIGGEFSQIGTSSRPRIARLLPDGSVDEGFDPGEGPNNGVSDLAVLENGDVIIFGSFTAVSGVPRAQLARLHSYDSRLDVPVRLASGEIQLRVHGQTGARVTIDSSENLDRWSPFRSEILTAPVVDLVDTNANSQPHRFYRVSP